MAAGFPGVTCGRPGLTREGLKHWSLRGRGCPANAHTRPGPTAQRHPLRPETLEQGAMRAKRRPGRGPALPGAPGAEPALGRESPATSRGRTHCGALRGLDMSRQPAPTPRSPAGSPEITWKAPRVPLTPARGVQAAGSRYTPGQPAAAARLLASRTAAPA